MRVLLFLFLVGTVDGQDRGLAPLARGVWQDWVGTDSNGSFHFKSEDQVYRCAFTTKTYFEREHKRTWISKIEQGQEVEVLSERVQDGTRCRALIVRVLTEKALESPRYRLRTWQAAAAELAGPRMSSATMPAPLPGSLAPLTRGVWQEWVGSDTNGSFLFKTEEQTHRCAFTSKTYFEREHKRTWVSKIESGQQVEVLSERVQDGTRCRALIVRVLTPKALESPRYKWRTWQAAAEIVAPRGNVVLTGIVLEHDEYSLKLRTRDGLRHLITLRDDTRFMAAGAASARMDLPAYQTIQVRAGKTYDNRVEAYSIVWGEILRPRQ
ncbi:MAG: hypothetical protein JST93_25050 [Acidobacteria bacterium]|nr:hypothetical protein [Acidobacteriota bacterium]